MTTPTTEAPEAGAAHGVGRPAQLAFALGTGCVVLGGLVAAVTSPLHISDGSWLAAYLVLVCGVAQCAFAWMPWWLTARPRPARPARVQLVSWNAGNVLVIAGTLTDLAWLVDVGGGFLMLGLGLAGHAVRHGTHPGRGARVAGRAYRALLLLLFVSVPVGSALAHLRGPT